MATCVFSVPSVRGFERRSGSGPKVGTKLKIRLRIARVFMARRAAILSWVRAQTSDEKNKYWNIVLEREQSWMS